MAVVPDIARDIIDALDEPALLLSGGRTLAANRAAHHLLGQMIEGSDVRLALRHPGALQMLLGGRDGELELVGIGGAERPWRMTVRSVGGGMRLVRLEDRSAALAAEKMRVDFVANASHELRTPLATIAGYAETLADESDLDEATRRGFASTVLSEARRMYRIVEDLMSLSRIEADRFAAPHEEVDLGEVARRAADNVAPLAEARTCAVNLAIEDGLLPVAGDFAQLCQAVDNLVANAVRYGCSARGCAVTVEVRRDGDRALLAVSDRGEGIAPVHLPFLTRRFYRVDAARSRDGGGTGLGLAIVKHIVERHRGSLDIRSRPGQGTTVELRLPFAR